ncbi:MAG: gliding motility-associated C-terminal domain-containing protein, partial [Flavobacteriaceae bacterium]
LTISDSANCSSEPIVFVLNASDSSDPFSIEGILQRVSTEGSDTEIDQVKVLPPNCMSTQSNGQIGIEISGGLRPYTIEWYKEEIQPETAIASSSVELVRLEGATNSTHLQNLEPGKYQLVIRSQNQECSQNSQISSNNYYEEFFNVPKNEELYIIDGPNIGDIDLCRLLPGIITVQVFDNSNGKLSFYYNNELVNPTHNQPTDSNIFNLVIENPVPYAELLISNERGCTVSTFVEIAEIATPEFEYTSPSIRASGMVLAREEIIFKNNSSLPYSYSIWHFGDGSTQRVDSRTLSPTTHTYGISGTYYVTLRNYNLLGCFEETTREIIVGKGYNVIAPNAFSPNGDGINDFYRPLFSGFARVLFRIYDERGNVLYTEELEKSNSTEITGIKLEGWNGQNAPQSPYYIYHFTGYLITDETEINRTGTFVIIR